MDVDAIDARVGQAKQRIEHPQRGHERVAEAAKSLAGDAVDLVDPNSDAPRVSGGDRGSDARRGPGRMWCKQVGERRIRRGAPRVVAALQRIEVKREQADSRVRG